MVRWLILTRAKSITGILRELSIRGWISILLLKVPRLLRLILMGGARMGTYLSDTLHKLKHEAYCFYGVLNSSVIPECRANVSLYKIWIDSFNMTGSAHPSLELSPFWFTECSWLDSRRQWWNKYPSRFCCQVFQTRRKSCCEYSWHVRCTRERCRGYTSHVSYLSWLGAKFDHWCQAQIWKCISWYAGGRQIGIYKLNFSLIPTCLFRVIQLTLFLMGLFELESMALYPLLLLTPIVLVVWLEREVGLWK